GCEIPAWRCDAHHIHTWTDGGATNMANLVLLCSYHHHLLHRSGWAAKLLPDNTFHVTLPNGTTLTSRPPP
ncbi:MAG: HNH endonuclease signature motif containing protein, partial [Acidimicrobiia bacterium]